MESTPPYLHSDPTQFSKSASRLAQLAATEQHSDELAKGRTPSSIPLKLSRPTASRPLQDLLLRSPSSPIQRTRSRVSDKLEMGDDPVYESFGSRRRCKAIASPRNGRRSRRRVEAEEREIMAALAAEEAAKARRKRHSGKSSRKEKLSLVPSGVPSPKDNASDQIALDRIGEAITDLITWRDVGKSSFWFGFGCLCFLSSCFTRKLSFSIFTAGSQLGLLFLGISFLSNTLFYRNNVKKRQEFKLTENDIVRVARVVLPTINVGISKTRRLFSGEASMTLKVALCFLIGAEYGHHITLWGLCAISFFTSFIVPKLHSLYARQIELKVEHAKWRMLEAWKTCSHKKGIVVTTATAFWNLSSFRTRILAAFLALVILQYLRQNSEAYLREEDSGVEEQEKLQQALIVAEEM